MNEYRNYTGTMLFHPKSLIRQRFGEVNFNLQTFLKVFDHLSDCRQMFSNVSVLATFKTKNTRKNGLSLTLYLIKYFEFSKKMVSHVIHKNICYNITSITTH